MRPSASTRFRLQLLARLRIVRLLACVLALSLLVTGFATAAQPLAAMAPGAAIGSAASDMHSDSAAAHCPQHEQASPPSGHGHHGGDGNCCVGKLCACGPACAGWVATSPPLALPRASTMMPGTKPPGTYATVASRPLRPPIA